MQARFQRIACLVAKEARCFSAMIHVPLNSAQRFLEGSSISGNKHLYRVFVESPRRSITEYGEAWFTRGFRDNASALASTCFCISGHEKVYIVKSNPEVGISDKWLTGFTVHLLVKIELTKQSSHQKYLRRSIPLYMLATWSP